MKRNEKKCKETVISFRKYQPTLVSPTPLNGAVIERVTKLLGVIILQDLAWNEHYNHIHNKALKRIYALRSLKKKGLNCDDLVLVYCSLVRSVIAYAFPVWPALLSYLEDLLEPIRRKALSIYISIFCNAFNVLITSLLFQKGKSLRASKLAGVGRCHWAATGHIISYFFISWKSTKPDYPITSKFR